MTTRPKSTIRRSSAAMFASIVSSRRFGRHRIAETDFARRVGPTAGGMPSGAHLMEAANGRLRRFLEARGLGSWRCLYGEHVA